MSKTFQVLASKGGEVIFDDYLEALHPREAREQMKTRLGLKTLTGVVYTVSQVPVALIRKIVVDEVARFFGQTPIDPTGIFPATRRARKTRIPATSQAIDGPDWKAIRGFYSNCRSLKRTAAHFNVPINTLKARVQRGGWNK